jgi:preprotein translocase subunit SecA
MDRALPEDVPIEARMVSRAIERAQNTVEARNAEVRKDVLKYDEVMNEQRKVIYERRLQILDGEDLREHTLELLESTIERVVRAACPTDFAEEWDLERLVNELAQYYPTQFSVADLEQAETVEQLVESVVADAVEHFDERERTLLGGEETARQVERQIMLQIIDQRWRLHLSEMDHLREGIHLRGIAQTDPLVAWQREGFELFGKLMESIDDDYLRYVMHVQLLVEQEAAPDFTQASFEAAEDPAGGLLAVAPDVPDGAAGLGPDGGAAQPAGAPRSPGSGEAPADQPDPAAGTGGRVAAAAPLAGTPGQGPKLGRNDPCWCGSGKKYKLCHGAS